MPAFSSEFRVLDTLGLHVRPAGQLVKLAKKFDSEIRIGRPGSDLRAISGPLALLAMKVKTGETLLVEIVTPDEVEAQRILALVEEILRG